MARCRSVLDRHSHRNSFYSPSNPHCFQSDLVQPLRSLVLGAVVVSIVAAVGGVDEQWQCHGRNMVSAPCLRDP